jgi:hypothetical protein
MAAMLPDDDDQMEKITDLLAWGNDVEIVELDKSGHPQQQWLHAHDGHVLPVSSLISFFRLSPCASDKHIIF